MTSPTEKQLSRLPKWARAHIEHLAAERKLALKELEQTQEMMPWIQPNMDWFTVFRPPHRGDREINIFTCDNEGTNKLFRLGRRDFLFIGRSKERDL